MFTSRFVLDRRSGLPVLFSSVVFSLAIARCTEAVVRTVDEKDGVRVSSPYLEIKLSLQQPAILALSVDALGSGKVGVSGSRGPAKSPKAYQVSQGENEGRVCVDYRRPGTADGVAPGWRLEVGDRDVRMISQWSEAEKPEPLVLDFDPAQCHATLLGLIDKDQTVRLPAVLHVPSQGSFRITAAGEAKAALGYDARRAGVPYVKVTFPPATADRPRMAYRLEVAAIYPRLAAIETDRRFDGFRRNWLNILQVNPRLGVLANHSASDTCAVCIYEYSDIARHTPPLAEGLTALDVIRQTLDRYLDGLPGYGLPGNVAFDWPNVTPHQDPPFLDSYPSLLVAAANYVEGSNDKAWLEKRYAGLRKWMEKELAMDHDGNGLFEYPYSGNSGSWSGAAEKRPANWWDTIGCGHEDAYANALAYRALEGMERMAARLGKTEDAARYRAAAQKLRKAYYPTFYNPATGVLAGWKSADGQLHDYYFLWVNGAAIHYGLVPKKEANAIMDRLMAKLKEVGYTRFEFGLPGNLVPIAKKDYVHQVRRWGGGQREDNSDGFQIYENGGATACFAYFTVAALYDLGHRDEADRILLPMLKAFENRGFEGSGPNGMTYDWKAWDGTPWGYEGFLTDNYYALLAVLDRPHGRDEHADPLKRSHR